MDLGIEGDSALVAASSSGLGKASATALAAAGADVVVNGRDGERLADAVEEIDAVGGGEVVGQRGDLTNPDDCAAMVDRAVEEFGGLDHLVTNAGGPPAGRFLDLDDEDWYDAYDLLVMSAVRLVREAADDLRAGDGGTVVFVASRSVKEALDALVLSNSVRMSVVGLEKTLSQELAPEVRANAVLPGPHETERTASLIEQGIERGDYEDYEDGLDQRSASIPLDRIGDPEQFGEVVAFLSGEPSEFVNGETVIVDGGATGATL